MWDDLKVTPHAHQQFTARYQTRHGRPPGGGELQRLLKTAMPEDLGPGFAIRLMRNGLQPARYFTSEGWRFVFAENENVLITVELAVNRKPGERRKDKRHSKQERRWRK